MSFADRLGVRELAGMIDHTLLRAEATPEDIGVLCEQAREHGFATVCVHPSYVDLAATALADSKVGVCTPVGFPFGANHMAVKAVEAHRAVVDGATELDMVLAIGRLKAGELEYVREDIAAVVGEARGRVVKVILEIGLLEPGEIELSCRIARDAGAGFVKTSTGFGPGGATVDAVALMRRIVGDSIGVKAAGGIRDAGTARALIEAGATRIGTSASLALLSGWEEDP